MDFCPFSQKIGGWTSSKIAPLVPAGLNLVVCKTVLRKASLQAYFFLMTSYCQEAIFGTFVTVFFCALYSGNEMLLLVSFTVLANAIGGISVQVSFMIKFCLIYCYNHYQKLCPVLVKHFCITNVMQLISLFKNFVRQLMKYRLCRQNYLAPILLWEHFQISLI